ncbi:MATE family efflux transporter [Calorimonas adulescens]|uniref:Probable multidrug resistance protein NorM n=1 Tax=Calorimonas adulescens TaxID=2606906 RepID=A0A5D8QAH7_9THEO|nr:MATE family efflux transporter [Calorimonas adulescens]TZE81397.1 MATE family efflux transporter [Calorimonas adulescens]
MTVNKEDISIINRMAIPVISTFAIETIFTITDKAIIGRTSVEGFAAVGIVSSLLYVLTGTFGMLSMAFNIIFAKSFAKRDRDKYSQIFNTSLSLSIVIGFAFGILGIIFGRTIFQKFYNLEGSTLTYACDYMNIAGFSLELNLIIFIFSAYFKNLKRTTMFMYGTITAIIVNLALDYILVFGKFGFPRLGVKGAAIGSVVGLLSSIVIYIIGFLKHTDFSYSFSISKTVSRNLIKLYLPLFGQDFIESSLFIMIITALVAKLGVYEVATYNLIDSINSILLLPVYAYSGAALTLTAQEYAKNNTGKMKSLPIIASVCSYIFVLIIGLILILFPMAVFTLITDNSKLILMSSDYITVAVFPQLFNVINQIYKYCLQGIDQEKWVFIYSLIVSSISALILWSITEYTGYGLYGIYLVLGLSYFLLGLGYFLKYIKTIKGIIVLTDQSTFNPDFDR